MYTDSYKSNKNVAENALALAIRPTPQRTFRTSFAKAVSGGVDTDNFTIIGSIGAGQTVNQTAGNLVVTGGTTARSETIIRSTESFSGAFTAKAKVIGSARVANNSLFYELVDVIGDGLVYTINSATSITVTIPNNPFTAANIGQGMTIGGFSGTGTFLSGRYLIASVSGNDVTFTVAGFAVGTGTCSLFGWNFHRVEYNSTVATTLQYDTQRNGYVSGQSTPTTTLTTASPGHLVTLKSDNGVSILGDQLVATTATPSLTIRASRFESMPGNEIPLFYQIRVANGSTAPTATTWTLGLASVEDYVPIQVSIVDARPQATDTLPVRVISAPTTTISGTVTSNEGTPVTPTASIVNSAASTNATVVKASAGTLYAIAVSNINAAVRYLKIYNKATAPTVGTDVPAITIPIPAGGIANIQWGKGLRYATGIGFALTTGATDADTGAVAANEIKVTISYI